MALPRQLYQLQEIDLEIAAAERSLQEMNARLGESQELIAARHKLNAAQKRLDDLKKQQHATDDEIVDLTAKIKKTDEELYSGRIRNPKELGSLQQEVNLLKAKNDKLETAALGLLEQAEQAEGALTAASEEFKKIEAEWRRQQQQLSTEIESVKNRLAGAQQQRAATAAEIEKLALEVYTRLKKLKGQAVARVEQGICRGCRISIASSELQKVRSGDVVYCSSCGRILFLP